MYVDEAPATTWAGPVANDAYVPPLGRKLAANRNYKDNDALVDVVLPADGDYLEAPFWIWTVSNPRRRRVFARHVGREIELTDRGDVRDLSLGCSIHQLCGNDDEPRGHREQLHELPW